MIYYRDKVLNNLFEDKINSALNYISQNPSVGEDETLVDIAYNNPRVYSPVIVCIGKLLSFRFSIFHYYS